MSPCTKVRISGRTREYPPRKIFSLHSRDVSERLQLRFSLSPYINCELYYAWVSSKRFLLHFNSWLVKVIASSPVCIQTGKTHHRVSESGRKKKHFEKLSRSSRKETAAEQPFICLVRLKFYNFMYLIFPKGFIVIYLSTLTINLSCERSSRCSWILR